MMNQELFKGLDFHIITEYATPGRVEFKGPPLQ